MVTGQVSWCVCPCVAIVWTQDDLLNLLEAMKVNLPQKDLAKYKTSESHLDWEKVAFNSFTGEMCKQKWNEVSKVVRHVSIMLYCGLGYCVFENKSGFPILVSSICTYCILPLQCVLCCSVSLVQIRKFRTLTELIFDAQDFIKNPYKGKKLKVSCMSSFYDRHYQLILSQVTHYFLSKLSSDDWFDCLFVCNFTHIWYCSFVLFFTEQKHPDFPKKPLTPYFRFFIEKRAKYAKLHPEMSNLDLTKILSMKYRGLPDKKKVRSRERVGRKRCN